MTRKSLNELFDDSDNVLKKVNEAKELPGGEVLLSILTTPAVDTLGLLSNYAKAAFRGDEREKFQEKAQALIDFLESQGHGNILKEQENIQQLCEAGFDIRVPEMFQPR